MMRKYNNLFLIGLAGLFLLSIPSISKADENPEIYRQGLVALQNQVPLTYNRYVHNYINLYSSSKKVRFAQMAGLSKYYFPIYEKIFKEWNIPEELKYISVIESSLNPHAVSQAGATGPWQFIHQIGRIYGLAVNDSIDERKDPVKASKAAASYLLDSYTMYGDWLLAIASYNCGRNNIKWAMEKAGGKADYWTLRQYLPVETQGYVPAYIATVYMMNNYGKYGITPIQADFNINTETVSIERTVPLSVIAQQANINLRELYLLNPSYVKQIVNGTKECPQQLVLPVLSDIGYNSICGILGLPERIPAPVYVAQIPAPKPVIKYSYSLSYKVQEGDTLASIAQKFDNITEEVLKETNKLTTDTLTPGTVLKIVQI